MTKYFVIYQLTNRKISTGVGCGYYDVEGNADGAGIARQMNDYLFDVCFNPDVDPRNVEHFIDFCLGNLTSGFWAGDDEEGYHPTVAGITGELDTGRLATYWNQHAKRIRDLNLTASQKTVTTLSYVTSYATALPKLFEVLDQIQAMAEGQSNVNVAASTEDSVAPQAIDKPAE